MSDSIGKIPVPDPVIYSATPFPLNPPFGVNVTLPSAMVVHTFYTGDAKTEQRFYLGNGAREWQWTQEADETERQAVRDFWEKTQGSHALFTFNAPDPTQPDGATTPTTVRFASEPLVFTYSTGAVAQIQIHLVEAVTPAIVDNAQPGDLHYASYQISNIVTRFPNQIFADALSAQAQTMIPLITIQPLDPNYPPIYVSDRRCWVGGQLYQARFIGHKGIGQSAVGLPNVTGQSDQVQFTFGNADRVMRALANDTNLEYATVQFSIYHVGSETRCDFWAGQVVPQGWQYDTSPQFTLICSDPLQSPFLIAPPRIIDHLCNAQFNDGIECPFATQSQGMDFVHFPNGDPATCDRSVDGPNGCLAHGMKYWFRGVFSAPQGVRIKDNSTGTFGIGRSTITSVSLINDSVWGMAVPIVVTDVELIPVIAGVTQNPIVKGYIIAGRDESDFYEALAVICEGPVTFPTSPNQTTLNGQYHANYPDPSKNIRLQTGGIGPTGAGFMSLDALGDQVNNATFQQGLPSWRFLWVPQQGNVNDHSQGFTVLDNYSSGIASIAIRISKPSGLTSLAGGTYALSNSSTGPGYINQYDLEADITSGWQGWKWTGPGARTGPVNLTNPIWLCVNLYLYCIRLKDAPASVQEQYFDVNAAVAAAAVCDEIVDRVVEIAEGQEIQYKFIGQIRDQRPLRDWITDILTNCLGYYSFSFGKIRFGIRYEASPVSAYTDGNIVFRTLQANPIGPQFTKLVMSFADFEYAWQTNSASYQDDDYAQELGGGARALHKVAQMNLSGTADISQATRLVITRAREEIGGITAAERHAARRITFKTTVLGLDTGPGDVISVYDAEMPNRTDPTTGDVIENNVVLARVETYSLAPDWSVTITARGVTPSMYDLTVGPIPPGAKPSPLRPVPPLKTNEPVWMPNQLAPPATDPIYGSFQDELTFGLVQDVNIRSDNSLMITLTITGEEPVNQSIPGTTGPLIGSFTTSSTGGYLPGGRSVFMAIALSNAQGSSPASNLMAIPIPSGTNTNSVTLNAITLPTPPTSGPWTTLTLYAALDDVRLLTSQANYTGDPSVIGDSSNGSWTIQGTSATLPLDRARANPPSPNYANVVVKGKYLYHSGVVGMDVTDVQTNVLTCNGLATGGDNWAGRVVSIIAAPLGFNLEVWNFTCTSYDNTTGAFTVTPDPVAAGVQIGSVLVVRYQADTITATSIGDSGIANSMYPGGQSDQIANAQIRVVEGTGRKQIRNIVSNTATVYTIDVPWTVQPDANSFWIVEARDWAYETNVLMAATQQQTWVSLTLPMDNLPMKPVVVGGFLMDRSGNLSEDDEIPVRDTYLFGTGQGYSPVTATSDYTIGPTDLLVFGDCSAGDITITAPDPKTIHHEIVIKRKSATANTNVVHITSAALIDGQTTVDLTSEGASITILATS